MSSQQEGGLEGENGQTHDDNFAGGGRTQDDPPCVRFLMLLETKHTYINPNKGKENNVKSRGKE